MAAKSKKALRCMSNHEFYKKFPTEKSAIDYFLAIRYKGVLICPHCGGDSYHLSGKKKTKSFSLP